MLNTVINFLFKNFIALWRHLAKTQLLSIIHIVPNRFEHHTVAVFSLGGATAKGGSCRVGERGVKGWAWSREGAMPLPRIFFEFLSRNGASLCILLMTGGMDPHLDPP